MTDKDKIRVHWMESSKYPPLEIEVEKYVGPKGDWFEVTETGGGTVKVWINRDAIKYVERIR